MHPIAILIPALCALMTACAAEHGGHREAVPAHGAAPVHATAAPASQPASAVQAAPAGHAAPAAHGTDGPGAERPAQGLTGRQALDRLLAGNKRFMTDVITLAHKGGARRAELASGQHPIAIIISCSDSRVPVEQLFDQGNGDVFVVRTAGNVVDAVALGSIEYAADHLHVPLIVVLGHERCGAVTAAVGTEPPPGHILAVVEHIQRHLKGTRPMPGDTVEQAVQLNARGVAQDIATSKPIVEGLVRSEEVVVVAARYDLDSGEVTLLP